MGKGIVRFYNEIMGFGYIRKHHGGDIFVHSSGLFEHIKHNDEVVFDILEENIGPRAINVKLFV